MPIELPEPRKWVRGAGRPEQQRRLRQRSLRAEAVPACRADAESGVRDRTLPDRARLHADAGAGRRARSTCVPASSLARSRSCRASSSIRARAGTSRLTSCGATTSASPRASADRRPRRHPDDAGGSDARPALPRRFGPHRHPPRSRRRSSMRSNTGIWRARRRSGRRTAELHRTLATGQGPDVRAGAAGSRRAGGAGRRDARRTQPRRSTCSRSSSTR